MGYAAKQLRRDRSAFDDRRSTGGSTDMRQRFARGPRALTGSTGGSDPVIEVRASDPFIEIHDSAPLIEIEETEGPWCVDLGDTIECMNSVQIWTALAAGKLTPEVKVWRDGHPCWLPIADVDELTCEPEHDDPFDVSTPSTSQVVPRTRPRWSSSGAPSESPSQPPSSQPPARPIVRTANSSERVFRHSSGGRIDSLPTLPRSSLFGQDRWFLTNRRALLAKLRRPQWLVAVVAVLAVLSFCVSYGWGFGALTAQDLPLLRRVAVDVAERSRFHADRLRDRLTRDSPMPTAEIESKGTSPLD
jgi:hypothetical protein